MRDSGRVSSPEPAGQSRHMDLGFSPPSVVLASVSEGP